MSTFRCQRNKASLLRSAILIAAAPVAQLDRADASGASGREFESLRARHPSFHNLLSKRRIHHERGSIAGMKKALTFILISLVLAAPTFAADNPDFTLKKIGDGVYAAVSGDDSKAGSNAGFIVGRNSVVVIDTFESVE